MKKILICLLTLLVLVGCGQKDDNNTSNVERPSSDTLGGKLANAFLDEAANSDDPVTIAEAIVGKNYTEYNLVVAEVEPGWLNGFSNDITEFTSGVCFQPMIGTRGPVADPQAQLKKRIDEQYNKLMAAYVQPELDREAFDKAKQIFVEAGVDAAVLDKIDTL